MRVLLVEPSYKNKYPPIGLMKIATYHKRKGDYVEFVKGKESLEHLGVFDRIYITSLFTFHFKTTVDTINHYIEIFGNHKIFVGGIASTLLPERFFEETQSIHIIPGKLTNSNIIGYEDEVNIDILPLDYDILDDIDYKYPVGDNYFIHTTIGCPNKCKFCAVPLLEPKFETRNNVIQQIKQVDGIFGAKKDMMIMDNNILNSEALEEIVNDIISLGYDKSKNWISPNKIKILYDKILRRNNFPNETNNLNTIRKIEDNILNLFYFKVLNKSLKLQEQYREIYQQLKFCFSENNIKYENELKIHRTVIVEFLYSHINEIVTLYEKHRNKQKAIRYLDCNQGIDARLLNGDNVKLLAKLPIRPCRYAYDDIKYTKYYEKAFRLSVENGIRIFSNYMLYNYKDSPEDLWLRMQKSIGLLNEANLCRNEKKKISGFFFPMRYAPINLTDRSYVGINWNRKFLRAMNVILNVTKGVVAKEQDFFEIAYGKNPDEFIKILSMPDDFIRNRNYFTEIGLIAIWENLYNQLSASERKIILGILSQSGFTLGNYSEKIKRLLCLYKISRLTIEKGLDVKNFAANISNANESKLKIIWENINSLNMQKRDIKQKRPII